MFQQRMKAMGQEPEVPLDPAQAMLQQAAQLPGSPFAAPAPK